MASFGALLAACANFQGPAADPAVSRALSPALNETTTLRWLDRVTWGANSAGAHQLTQQGLAAWLTAQLHPRQAALPVAAQAQIDAMTISRVPVEELAVALGEQRRAAGALIDDGEKKAALRAYQQALTRLLHEAQQRFLLRALYSPHQLHEQMSWFWMNHFNVDARKANIRALIGDYEESAIRPHALGRFRDLLGATMHHPAMLRYLDNAQNAAGHLNENYARELMELHTLGVGSGYSQADVQELARVLTGIGVDQRPLDAPPPRLRPALRAEYVRKGLFEFNPGRHDYGPKVFLGQPITRHGLAESGESLDHLAHAPATAHFIAHKLAVFWVADEPPRALVDRMADTFSRNDGDIAATLATMFAAPEFAASLGRKFRVPVHYVVAGVRLAYDDRVVQNFNPMLDWLNRMGQLMYLHAAPDGYALTQSAWASAGQMTTRFEIARALGSYGGLLFRIDPAAPVEQPPYPPLASSPMVAALQRSLSVPTRGALAQARSPPDWNTFLLASPEFMNR